MTRPVALSYRNVESTIAKARLSLRILATSDLHMQLMPYDYFADQPDPSLGFGRVACMIRQARADAQNNLTFDNGDFLEGTPMSDVLTLAHERGTPWPHPFVSALNALGYDAATIGNHEFNYGLPFLQHATAGAEFPFVLSNVSRKQGKTICEDVTLFAPCVLLDRQFVDHGGHTQTLRVGVIGFTPPQVVIWDRMHLDGKVHARGIVDTARAWVPRLRAQGADLVVALCHSGIGEGNNGPDTENAALDLAAVDGIDVLIAGHSHRVFPSSDFPDTGGIDPARGTLHGKPAVMPGMWGDHLGVIDLVLETDGKGWTVTDAKTKVLSVPPLGVDEGTEDADRIAELADDAHRATLAHIRKPAGRVTGPLHTYFAMVEGSGVLDLVAQAQSSAVRDALADTQYESVPVLSAVAPFKCGGHAGPGNYTDIPAGDLAIRHIADLYGFPNLIRAICVTGRDIREWLDRSASAFNSIRPGTQDAALLDPTFPSYNFDVLYGLDYSIDLSRPPLFGADGKTTGSTETRIRDLSFAGRPVVDDMTFVIATNSHRVAAHGAARATVVWAPPTFNRDVLLRYVTDHSPVTPVPTAGWRLTPLPGTSVTFKTGPGARRYASQSRLRLKEVGTDACGFVTYKFDL